MVSPLLNAYTFVHHIELGHCKECGSLAHSYHPPTIDSTQYHGKTAENDVHTIKVSHDVYHGLNAENLNLDNYIHAYNDSFRTVKADLPTWEELQQAEQAYLKAKAGVSTGTVSKSELDAATTRVLTLKQQAKTAYTQYGKDIDWLKSMVSSSTDRSSQHDSNLKKEMPKLAQSPQGQQGGQQKPSSEKEDKDEKTTPLSDNKVSRPPTTSTHHFPHSSSGGGTGLHTASTSGLTHAPSHHSTPHTPISQTTSENSKTSHGSSPAPAGAGGGRGMMMPPPNGGAGDKTRQRRWIENESFDPTQVDWHTAPIKDSVSSSHIGTTPIDTSSGVPSPPPLSNPTTLDTPPPENSSPAETSDTGTTTSTSTPAPTPATPGTEPVFKLPPIVGDAGSPKEKS